MPTPAPARSAAKTAAASRWAAGPAWDPVKTATRTPGSARVGPADPLGDADGLVAALALDGDGERVLHPARDLLAVLEHDPRADLGADGHRGGEARSEENT